MGHWSGGVFTHHGFRRLWLANLTGGFGQQFATLALGVTAVVVLHASTLQLGIIAALGTAANLILGIPIGVWVDALPQKWVLVVAGVARAAAVVTIPLAFLAGILTIVQCMGVAAIVGTATVFFDTAHTSILPSLLSADRVSEANARLQTSDSTVRIVGPGLAGQLLRITGAPILYFVTGAMEIISAILVSSMKIDLPETARKQRQPFWASLREGLAYVIRHPVLRVFNITNAAINLGAGVVSAVFLFFALNQLHIAPSVYGLILSVGAFGGILGSLIALPLARRYGDLRTRSATLYILPFTVALIPCAAIFPFSQIFTLGAAEFLISAVLVTTSIPAAGIRARVTPLALMGRVSAASRFVSLGVLPLGALLGGLLGGVLGAGGALWIAVGLMLIGAAFMLVSPLGRIRHLPAEYVLTEADTVNHYDDH